VSILLFKLPEELGEATARRLLGEGDEVRVLLTGGEMGDAYADLPVHIATGEYPDDADLIERAAQNVRTIVLGGELPSPKDAHVKALVEGARAAGVSRIIYCDGAPDAVIVTALRDSRTEYVVLAAGRGGLLRRGFAIPAESLAEAIDAADDLADALHDELDLSKAESWHRLRLEVPPN
jgi:hypothetical protein